MICIKNFFVCNLSSDHPVPHRSFDFHVFRFPTRTRTLQNVPHFILVLLQIEFFLVYVSGSSGIYFAEKNEVSIQIYFLIYG